MNLTNSSYAILGLLSKGKSSGYKLKQIMGKVATYYCSESNAQIYPTLKALEKAGLVKSELNKASGARKRKDYTLTAKGKEVVMTWLAEPVSISPYREEMLLKISLGQHLSNAQLRVHLEHYQKEITTRMEDIDDVLEHIHTDHKDNVDQPYLFMTYEHMKMILETKLKWCQKMLQKLES